MTENRQGKVVTFYSFKGGTGRTMALANVAWILAANGKRVLVADWDLESPGLHRFFHPFVDGRQMANADGVIDLIREYEWATTADIPRSADWYEAYAKASRHAFSLIWEFPDGGGIDLLPAGVQRLDYAQSVYGTDWDTFHDRLNGGLFLDALRADMKASYDYALIDSRTGFSDVADICTIHLPDVLVDCFTYSSQGVEGASQVASHIQNVYGSRNIRILPVPMRVDPAEKAKEELGRSMARVRFRGLPNGLSEEERATYWNTVAVPYHAFYAYEETLATFGDEPGSPRSLLYAYETLTRYITRGEVSSMPPMDSALRARVRDSFMRRSSLVEDEVLLRFEPAEQVWAEWVEHILTCADVRVITWPGTLSASPAGENSTAREMRLVSARSDDMKSSYLIRANAAEPLVLYVDTMPALMGSAFGREQSINGVSASVAAERILDLVGRKATTVDADGPRYPGNDPAIFKAPARNSYFTGREVDLLNLRQQLISEERGRIAVLSGAVTTVSLQGMGGIGKTWMALEYAYRYRSSYDLVWWIHSDPTNFIDTELADLGRRLGLLTNQPQPSPLDMARAVLRALERGEPYSRWLLVFDNAEDIEKVSQFLPQSGGHVLITSRDLGWRDKSKPITLEVFRRDESMDHLRSRVPGITVDEAHGVANMLGDLPIAVAAAAAWLADTATPVAQYLTQLEQLGPNDPSVEQTWNLALRHLKSSSPAAFRLLQLCSVMGPEIHTDLVYSDTMADALIEFDKTVVDRHVRGRLVQQINRLALLKVDVANSQLLVHRVLQSVVRARMTEEERDAARHVVHGVLAAARPQAEIDDSATWPMYQQLWPHLEVSRAEECDEEGMRELLIDRVRFLYGTGSDEDHANALKIAERVENTWQRHLAEATGEERQTILKQLLHMRFNVANVARVVGDITRSYELDRSTFEQQVELLGPEHPHSLLTAGSLAADLRALGRYGEALDRDQLTHRTWAENFGPDYSRTLSALNNLAAAFRHMGNYRRALELDQDALARRRVVSGDTHPATLVTASNLARDYREAGEYDRSVELLRQTLDILQHKYGDDFRTTLNVRANLAISLRGAGQPEEAAVLLDKAYIGLIDTAGQDSPDTLACRFSRAVNLLALARAHASGAEIERARQELALVRDGYQVLLGPGHPHTLLCINNLAAAARAAGDLEDARDLAAQAVAGLTEVLGADHPYTLAARMNLSICWAELNDVASAVESLKDVAERLSLVLGSDHPDTLRCRANIALGQRALDGDRADGAQQEMYEQLAGRLNSRHPAVEALREGRYLHRVVEPHPF